MKLHAGVDIGGTKVSVSLARVAAGGALPHLLLRLEEPTAKQGAHDAVALQVMALLAQACRRAGVEETAIEAVGVSSCGPFVRQGGQLEIAAPNICGGLAGPDRGLPNDWRSALLEQPLAGRYPRLRIENDAVAALVAERRWGSLRGCEHCAYVTWSTGVGIGLCVDGRVLHGKHGNAGHAGHTFVVDDASGALCGCGNRGDVEALVAGNALVRRFGMDGPALMAAARGGEPLALQRVDELCRVMGRMLYNLVVTLDLERISLGGGVFWHNRDLLLPRLQAQIAGRLPALTGGFELVGTELGPALGDYAALSLVS